MLLFGPTCKLKTSYISIQVWNASVPEWVNEPNQTVWTGSLKKKSNIFISTILLEWLCVSIWKDDIQDKPPPSPLLCHSFKTKRK